jgi:hypothetical protein
MLSSRSVRRLCWLGAAICFGVLLIPNFSRSTIPDGVQTRVDLGLPFSPWFHFEDDRTETKATDRTAPSFSSTFRSAWRFQFISWSALAMLAGIGFLIGAKYARQRELAKSPH